MTTAIKHHLLTVGRVARRRMMLTYYKYAALLLLLTPCPQSKSNALNASLTVLSDFVVSNSKMSSLQ